MSASLHRFRAAQGVQLTAIVLVHWHRAPMGLAEDQPPCPPLGVSLDLSRPGALRVLARSDILCD